MKKARFLALALVVAVMMVGAGYAWWTDSTTIQSTVSTGELNVDVQWASITNPQYTGGTVTGGLNRNEDPNKIVVNFTDLYPTKYDATSATFARIHFSVVNKGTIPVKLDSIDFEQINPLSKAWDYLQTVIHIHKGIPSDGSGTSLGTQASLTGVNAIGSHTVTNPKYLRDLKTLLLDESTLDEIVLMPGEAIWFGGNTEDESSIRFWLNENAPNDTTENQDIGFTLKLNWKQFNAQ